jgi:hypothetical protein
MSKLYVFGIGGTGARVLRALTLLLASGVECKSTIVPIIIDPDINNGDLYRTVSLMQKYIAVRDKLDFDNSQKNQFYRTEILDTVEGFILPLTDIQDKSFEQYINIAGMDDANKALMKMLFSDKNLESDMRVGFKGNPNVGSIVLNQFKGPVFEEFANSFASDDRIFIVSSIFGGTGASGFPLLLKTLRANKKLPNFALLNNATIGAVTVLPYFTVKQNEGSSISSETFISKTKSALSYYDRNISGNKGINVLYYIGDNVKGKGYENNEGGNEQQNKAHLIEMLSALAIIDFEASSEQRKSMICKEFGLDKGGDEITFSNFAYKTRDIIRRPMIGHALFMQYMARVSDKEKTTQQWARDRKFSETFFHSDFIEDLRYIQEGYHEWLTEMANNHVRFSPFTLDGDNLFGMVKGLPPKGVISLNRNYALFDDRLDGREQHAYSKGEKSEQLFMELFYRTIQQLIDEKFKI